MNRRMLAISLALATSTLLATGCATAPAPTPVANKMVIQVSDGDTAKWNLALNNANNAKNDTSVQNLQIELVAFGPGVGMLRSDALTANRVSDAIKSGINIVACENTMTAQKLVKADMNPSISYVPAGVIQLMKRQQQGWAYIRP